MCVRILDAAYNLFAKTADFASMVLKAENGKVVAISSPTMGFCKLAQARGPVQQA